MEVCTRLTLLEQYDSGKPAFLQVPQIDRRTSSFEVPLKRVTISVGLGPLVEP
jgi:hypothetical protein